MMHSKNPILKSATTMMSHLRYIKETFLGDKKHVCYTYFVFPILIIKLICYGLVSETSIYNPIDPQDRNKSRSELILHVKYLPSTFLKFIIFYNILF